MASAVAVLLHEPDLVPAEKAAGQVRDVVRRIDHLGAFVVDITGKKFKHIARHQGVELRIHLIDHQQSTLLERLDDWTGQCQQFDGPCRFGILESEIFTMGLCFPGFIAPGLDDEKRQFRPAVARISQFVDNDVLDGRIGHPDQSHKVMFVFGKVHLRHRNGHPNFRGVEDDAHFREPLDKQFQFWMFCRLGRGKQGGQGQPRIIQNDMLEQSSPFPTDDFACRIPEKQILLRFALQIKEFLGHPFAIDEKTIAIKPPGQKETGFQHCVLFLGPRIQMERFDVAQPFCGCIILQQYAFLDHLHGLQQIAFPAGVRPIDRRQFRHGDIVLAIDGLRVFSDWAGDHRKSSLIFKGKKVLHHNFHEHFRTSYTKKYSTIAAFLLRITVKIAKAKNVFANVYTSADL